jgi:hypothetical protein
VSPPGIPQATSLAGLPVRPGCPTCGRELRHIRTDRGQFAICDRHHAHRVEGVLPQVGAGDPHVQLRLGRRAA